MAKIARMSVERGRSELREARLEAAPFAGAILAANLLLAVVSREAGWELFGRQDWWLWLLVAAPSAVLVVTFLGGSERNRGTGRREIAIALLALLGLGNAAGIGCVVVSLTSWEPTGPQLLVTAATVLVTNAITFALAFWELDCGGPVSRALADRRSSPDFQFPQDENPALARPGWAPGLVDYGYVSLTNSVAFSPTDAMPLSRPAKLLMGVEATVSGVTILLVAARAINVLG